MKKLSAIFLALVFCIAFFVGCGNGESLSGGNFEEGMNAESETEEEAFVY